MTGRMTLLCLMFLLLAGCTEPATSAKPTVTGGQSRDPENITIYVGGMNQKLQIL